MCDACSLLNKEPKDINNTLQLAQTSFINELKAKLTSHSILIRNTQKVSV